MPWNARINRIGIGTEFRPAFPPFAPSIKRFEAPEFHWRKIIVIFNAIFGQSQDWHAASEDTQVTTCVSYDAGKVSPFSRFIGNKS